jgi:hypothetical protein
MVWLHKHYVRVICSVYLSDTNALWCTAATQLTCLLAFAHVLQFVRGDIFRKYSKINDGHELF